MKKFFTHPIVLASIHLMALAVLAFAQPLLDMLGKNPTFFVANRVSSLQILLLTAVLCLGIPLLVALPALIARMMGEKVWKIVVAVEVALLVGIIFLPVVKKIGGLSATDLIGLALVIGGAVGILYYKTKAAQTFASALGLAIIAVPVMFLFLSPVKRIVFPQKPPSFSMESGSDGGGPIVMVVFDELNTIALMDSSFSIDSARYPNFAALARTSYWFRNTTCVSDVTEKSVPAILSGQFPSESNNVLPTIYDFPNNLFSWLAGTYHLNVIESLTSLAPPDSSKDLTESPLLSQADLKTLSSDLSIIYSHILLPEEVTRSLPTVRQNWGNFSLGNVEAEKENNVSLAIDRQAIDYKAGQSSFKRFKTLEKFLGSLKKIEKPRLDFLHIQLPHIPWVVLPSGKLYRSHNDYVPGLINEVWTTDPNYPLLANQRYLLQVGYVDRFIGMLIDTLKRRDMFDEATIIITSDHGVAFQAGQSRRILSEANAREILPIPFFLKLPHQDRGIVNDRNIESIDILPTLAHAIGLHLPWETDGQSALDTLLIERKEKKALSTSHKVFHYPPQFREIEAAVVRQNHSFGSGLLDGKLYCPGGYAELFGKDVNEIPVRGDDSWLIEVDNKKYYDSIDTSSQYLLTRISGTIVKGSFDSLTTLAITVNEKIWSTCKILSGDVNQFFSFIPENTLRNGNNRIGVFVVKNDPSVTLIRTQQFEEFQLSYDGKGSRILESSTQSYAVRPSIGTVGYIDSILFDENRFYIEGWAADTTRGATPEAVVVFVNGQFVRRGFTGVRRRPDLVSLFKKPNLVNAGYGLDNFSESFRDLRDPIIQVFALFQDSVSVELYNRTNIGHVRSLPILTTYELRRSPLGKVLSLSSDNGNEAVFKESDLRGHVDQVQVKKDVVEVRGWAGQTTFSQPASAIAVFSGDKNIGTFETGIDRPDLVNEEKKSQLRRSGFLIRLPRGRLKQINGKLDLSVFGISNDKKVAAELMYYNGYPFNHFAMSTPIQQQYSFAIDKVGKSVLRAQGDLNIPVLEDVIAGNVDIASIDGDNLRIACWAAETQAGNPAGAIVVMVNGKSIKVISPNASRPDLVKAFKKASLFMSGVETTVPKSALGNPETAKIRFFAISQDGKRASELKYGEKYSFKR